MLLVWIEVLLWISLGLVAYSYLVYPVLIWACAQLFGRRHAPADLNDADCPSVSLLVAAHNEERWIRQRVENALALDYPEGKLEVLIASDGSTDGTVNLVRAFTDSRVKLLEYRENRGKASVLNASLPTARGEIVVFSDANTFFEPAAIRKLVRWFVDPAIGAVCGRLVLTDPATGTNVDSLYWKYETFLKKCESRLGALLGANGAIYALRRGCYVPIPPDTIVDDFMIPLLAKLQSGAANVYDADAVAHEECPPQIADEFKRRARIGAGGFQSIVRLWRLLSPARGWIAFTFFSHKLLRWLCPFLLIVALATSAALCREPFYAGLLAAQVAFYLAAWAGGRLGGHGIVARLMRVPAMFTSMNLALLCGFWRWLSGQQRGVWQRTAR